MWSFQYVPGPNLYIEGLLRVHGLSILVKKHAIWNEELLKALWPLPNYTRHQSEGDHMAPITLVVYGLHAYICI